MQCLYYFVTLYDKLFCRVMSGLEIDTACRGHPGECGSWITEPESTGNASYSSALDLTRVGSIHFVWGQAKFR